MRLLIIQVDIFVSKAFNDYFLKGYYGDYFVDMIVELKKKIFK